LSKGYDRFEARALVESKVSDVIDNWQSRC